MRLLLAAIAVLAIGVCCPAQDRVDWSQSILPPALQQPVDWTQSILPVTAVPKAYRVVYEWDGPNCPPCVDKDADKVKFAKEFALEGVAFHPGQQALPHIQPDRIPHLRWKDSTGVWRYQTGWHGGAHFLGVLKATDEAAEKARAKVSTPAKRPPVQTSTSETETRPRVVSLTERR